MNAPLWFSNLLSWSAQVAIIAFAAWLLARILRIEEPRALLIQWRTLILACLLLPLIEPWHRLTANLLIPAASGTSFPDSTAVPASATSHSALSIALLAQIIGIVILAGIALRLTIIAFGLFKLRQLRRASSAVLSQPGFPTILAQMADETGARAEARISAKLYSPVTFGFTRPIILLPDRFFHLDAQAQAAILCHELLHVRRRDWAHHVAEETLRALLWFHPAIHWLVSRVRLAREQLVDREVVRLTGARKTYLQALLEFTGTPGRAVAIPAPPFLAERQVVERVALMLKEVRMSRTRMIVSLSAAGCLLVACAVLAVSVFPLQAAPRPQNSSQAQTAAPASSPVVEANTIWTDKVKRGDMPIQVRGLAKLASSASSGNPVVRISLPERMMGDARVGQTAEVDTHNGVVKGHVSSVSRQVILGVRTADITLDSPLPKTADSTASFDATIEIGKLENVVYVGRPAQAVGLLFKLSDDGKEADRVHV